MELFRAVKAANPNVAVVLFNGRPLLLDELSRDAAAILQAWLPGTEGGHAILRPSDRYKKSIRKASDDISRGIWDRSRFTTTIFPPGVR